VGRLCNMSKRVDLINHPPHYTDGGIEVIDIMQSKMTPLEFEGYLRGNVIKYILRAGKKPGHGAGTTARLEDLKKAQWYLNKLVSVSENYNGIKKPERCKFFIDKKCTFTPVGVERYIPPDNCVLSHKDCPVFQLK